MRKRWMAGLGVAVLIVGLAVANRHDLIRFALERAAGAATGYSVTIGDQRLGTSHGAFLKVAVTRNGEPVLSAARIDLYYSLRDLLPGSTHRYGLTAVAIDHPALTVVRNPDRSLNILLPSGGAKTAVPQRVDPVPWRFTVRVRDGSAQMMYGAPKPTTQYLTNITSDATIDSSARTHYVVTGAFEDTKNEPFRATGTIDVARGYAIHRLQAAAVPIRTIGNFIIDAPSATILAGTAHDLDAKYYALDVSPQSSGTYHLGARLDVSDGQMYVSSLAQPLKNIQGRLQIVDDAFFANRLAATLAGVPVVVNGGIYDFHDAHVQLGISGTGDLSDLRGVLGFARKQPVSGRATVGVLLEGPLSAPILVAHLDAPAAHYRTLPLQNARAEIALADRTVLVSPLNVRYGGIAVAVRGSLDLGTSVRSDLVVHADAPGVRFPYLDELLPGEPIVADAILSGSNLAIGAHGSFASARDVSRAGGIFSFDADGVADVAPLYIDAGSGTLYGRYMLDRRTGRSAFWFDADDVAVRAPAVEPFPGVPMIRLPVLDGRIAKIAGVGGGPSGAIVVAGRASARPLVIAGVRFTSLAATFGGGLDDVTIGGLHASGPWGRFDGDGGFSTQTLVARGTYAGTLAGLHPFLGGAAGSGAVSGPASLAIGSNGVIVQSSALHLAHATIHGVPISRVAGTIAYRRGVLQVYSADASVAGGRMVAAGAFGPNQTVQIVGSNLHGDDARALGLPIDSGAVSLAGALGPGGKIPSFVGGVVVSRGRSEGYPVQGAASLDLHAGRLRVTNAVVALGGAFGLVDGRIDRIATGLPLYALRADVPAADVVGTMTTLRLPNFATEGVFNAQLTIDGAGTQPGVRGTVGVPGGEINGLPFIDASAVLEARAKSVSARHGDVRVGSTEVRFFGNTNGSNQSLGVRTSGATFSDFNNFFDTGDTLAGTGAVAFAIVDNAKHLATRGRVNVRAFRYRALPIGDTTASWSSRNSLVRGTLAIDGTHGALAVDGAMTMARSPTLAKTLADSRYDVSAKLAHLDLSTWLPALGYPQVPLFGRLDGSGRVVGTYPLLRVTSTAELVDGSFAGLPIDSLTTSVASGADAIELRDARLEAPGLSASAVGSIGLRPGAALRLSIHASSSDVPKLVSSLIKKSVDIGGTFETTVDIGGTLAAPTYAAAFDARNIDAYGVRASTLFGSAKIDRGTLVLHDVGATFAHGEASLAGGLPLQLQPFGFGGPNQPVSFDVSLSGVDPQAFEALVGSDTKLGGTLDGHVGLSGTVSAPKIFGQIQLARGSYTSALERVPITGAAATVNFSGTGASLSAASAHFGSGTVKASGTAAFERGFGEASTLQYALHADASGAQIDLPAYGSGAIDGALDLTRTPPGMATLKGSATLSQATIPFSAFAGSGKGGDGAPGAPPPALGLDLHVKAGQGVRIRGGSVGAGLDIGATGSVAIAGTLAAPSLDGVFTSTGGTLTYFDRAFRMQSGTMTFNPGDGLLPTLSATAATNIVNPDPDRSRNPYGSADITIKVEGRIDNLSFSFDTNPPGYTREQIIAMIAPFGGFANGIAFNPVTGGPSTLAAPGLPGGLPATTGQPIPGVLVQQENGTITVGQEAFNILNAQFTSGLLAPVENVLGHQLGLENLSLTVDYYGNVGVNVHRGLGRFINAVYSSTFGIPQTNSFGLQYAPNDSTAAQLTFFFTNGPTRFFEQPGTAGNLRVTTGEALQGQNGFAFTLQRFFK